MTPECSIKDLADTIQLRLTQEAALMSSSTIQSISATLIDAARHVHEILNSRQPLFKLPNEVLARIVSSISSWPMDEISEIDRKPIWRSAARDTTALLPVTHICRRLRQVVIADTTCWRHITTCDRPLAELSLSRNGSTNALTMWLSPRAPRSPSRTPLTEFHHQIAPRLRELHFHKCMPKNFPGLRQFLELSFPNLDSFSWTGEMTARDWAQYEDNMLPSSGFTAPSLRYLHIQQMIMLFPTSTLPCLTHLCITSHSATDLLHLIGNILRHCPALTSLILRELSSMGGMFDVAVMPEAQAQAQAIHLPSLSRVILADMEFSAMEYFAHLLAGHTPCMQIVLTDQGDTIYAYETEFFTSLYLQYWLPDQATDTSRLSVAAHAFEGHSASGLSVTLANSARVLHVSMSPRAVQWDVVRSGGRSEWRERVLTPLRTLPDLRELWLTDMHIDNFMPTDYLPFGGAPEPSRDTENAPRPGPSQAQAATLPSLESVVIVFNCSLRNCEHGLAIHPSLAALSKSPRVDSGNSDGSSPGAPTPLARLRLVIGYDATYLHRLRETWQSAQLLRGQGRVDFSGKLLSELASGEYAYVKGATLVVQLMPHLALDAGELAQLREHFTAVEVEEIDRLPTVPVPDCVRDDAMVSECFVSNNVLC